MNTHLPVDPTRELPRDHNGNVFVAHLDPVPTTEEANFERLSQDQLNDDLDAAHAQRALDVAHIPAGQQVTHRDTVTANRTWSIAAHRAQAFWEARRDHFYLQHLGRAYPGMMRPEKGVFHMNPYPHDHLDPKVRQKRIVRQHALEHAEHWLRRNQTALLSPAPAPPKPTKADIAKAKEKIIDRLVAEELRKNGLAI